MPLTTQFGREVPGRFTVQRSGDVESPLSSGSTSASSASRRPGSRSTALFRPPPGLRTPPNGSSPASNSSTPQLQAKHGTVLVVVDQPASIGALPLAVARDMDCPVAYLPGLTMRRIADLYPGEAKTDAKDAFIIADAARAMPHTLRTR